MNWKRGLNRLFVVAYGMWLLLMFVYMPWRMMESETKWLAAVSASSQVQPEELDRIRARISWSYQYGELAKEFREEPVVWLFFLYPFVAYALIYIVIKIGIWTVRGFSKEGS